MSEEKSGASPLSARGVSAGYGRKTVLGDLSLEIPRGRVTTVIGANGCGKSTLLRVFARLMTPTAGQVLLEGEPLAGLRPRDLARRVTLLPQNPVAPEGMTVADLAARGRQPHQPWYRRWDPEDDRIAAEAMAATGVGELADTPLEELSGGQRQRAWIAMALAQQTELMLLDEPTNHLDLAYAVEVLDLVVRLCRDTGRTIVMVLHDLNLAARYSDHLAVMRDGTLAAQGPPRSVLTPELLWDSFGLRAHVFDDPLDGLPTVVAARTQRA
ncbi:ABC transporter ATP-binding protein [Streptomyces sp. AJS327]|uniref:ABC transporter ATP-binding protein n=1 Tax=Streptomyces sp. AJS327 TaxID=2545265 RepID=UPI0015DDE02F|nr:ABC transporter ATP-binding protein [Streptomyces sp. AJS327]MBA0050947.1 ABC transporter ATP-binding protein [Streptomyces sp. AJS327]